MTLDDILTIPACREAVGVSSTSEDATLTTLRTAAVGWLARRVDREIVDRTFTTDRKRFVYQTRHRDGRPRFFFRATDIKADQPITLFASTGTSPGPRPTTGLVLTTANAVMSVGLQGLTLYEILSGSEMTDDLASIYRLEAPTPAVSLSVGMDAGNLPDEWPAAVQMVVRALYEGSAFDTIGSSSMLDILLAPWNGIPESEY